MTDADDQARNRALELEDLLLRRGRLLPAELVRLGQLILLSDDDACDFRDALKTFEEALTLDDNNVPALLEIGWFHDSANDAPDIARPYFERAIEILREQIREAAEGWAGCVRQLEGHAAGEKALQSLAEGLMDLEEIRSKYLPGVD